MTPWIAARQASLSITNSWSLLKSMSIQSLFQILPWNVPTFHEVTCTRAPWGVGRRQWFKITVHLALTLWSYSRKEHGCLQLRISFDQAIVLFIAMLQKQLEIRPKVVYHAIFTRKNNCSGTPQPPIKRRMAIKKYSQMTKEDSSQSVYQNPPEGL